MAIFIKVVQVVAIAFCFFVAAAGMIQALAVKLGDINPGSSVAAPLAIAAIFFTLGLIQVVLLVKGIWQMD